MYSKLYSQLLFNSFYYIKAIYDNRNVVIKGKFDRYLITNNKVSMVFKIEKPTSLIDRELTVSIDTIKNQKDLMDLGYIPKYSDIHISGRKPSKLKFTDTKIFSDLGLTSSNLIHVWMYQSEYDKGGHHKVFDFEDHIDKLKVTGIGFNAGSSAVHNHGFRILYYKIEDNSIKSYDRDFEITIGKDLNPIFKFKTLPKDCYATYKDACNVLEDTLCEF